MTKTKKERVSELFEFLMDLLEEKDEIKVETKNSPNSPNSPNFSPTNGDNLPAFLTKSPINHSLELMNKMEEIDKRNSEILNKQRIVKEAVKPLVKELEALRIAAQQNALEEKEQEEKEDVLNNEEKSGLTLVDGKLKVVSVPNKLRDNIPLTEEDILNINSENLEKVDKLITPVTEKIKVSKISKNKTKKK